MTQTLTIGAFALAALAISPLLASWTTALCTNVQRGWWRPRPVPTAVWLLIAVSAAALAALASVQTPSLAWWLFATGGAVLAVVDMRTHLLPSRLVYPLAAVELVTLMSCAVVNGDLSQLGRAVLASAMVGAGWFAVAFCSPGSLGLGDVRLATVAAGLLGWRGWHQVFAGQLVIWLLAVVVAGGSAVARRSTDVRGMKVPLGLPLVLAPLLVGL